MNSLLLGILFANVLSSIAAFAAAGLWYWSGKLSIPYDETPVNGFSPAVVSVDGADFVATALEQQRWSRRAALAAGTAAMFQGIAIFLSLFI